MRSGVWFYEWANIGSMMSGLQSLRYKGIIFDMDGTLTVPLIDFEKIRIELGLSGEKDMLEEIDSWPDAKRKEAWDLIESYEKEVISSNMLQPGCRDALVRFRESGVKLGILTRNTISGVEAFVGLIGIEFDAVLTREHPHVKPSPLPVQEILGIWKLAPNDVLMVGDYIHDIESGKAAGTGTCFFHNPGAKFFGDLADFSVSSFGELEKIVRKVQH
ncbi:MAG: HAD family hydrolase [Victivallales bacterium]|nr:HAD family hydrolase [Victivallales bacterium]